MWSPVWVLVRAPMAELGPGRVCVWMHVLVWVRGRDPVVLAHGGRPRPPGIPLWAAGCDWPLVLCRRYMSQNKHAEARELMCSGALLFFRHGQVSSGCGGGVPCSGRRVGVGVSRGRDAGPWGTVPMLGMWVAPCPC